MGGVSVLGGMPQGEARSLTARRTALSREPQLVDRFALGPECAPVAPARGRLCGTGERGDELRTAVRGLATTPARDTREPGSRDACLTAATYLGSLTTCSRNASPRGAHVFTAPSTGADTHAWTLDGVWEKPVTAHTTASSAAEETSIDECNVRLLVNGDGDMMLLLRQYYPFNGEHNVVTLSRLGGAP